MLIKNILSSFRATLEDRRILITGASRGLGSVCAAAFSEQGARLVLLARSKNELEDVRRSCANSEKHYTVPGDLTDINMLHNCVAAACEFFGGFDVVLHVAGGGLGLKETLINANDFIKLFTLNVAAAADINRLVMPSMLEQGKGNLVHVASISANEANASVGYNTVKAALAAYVRSIGNELAASGVVATGILPGGFYAPGNSWERLKAHKPDVVKQFVQERLPRNRLADAEELIPLLSFLCSDGASMMGGCMVPIDAGEGKAFVRS